MINIDNALDQLQDQIETQEQEGTTLTPYALGNMIAAQGEYITGDDDQLRFYNDKHIWEVADNRIELEQQIMSGLKEKFSRSKFSDAKKALMIKTRIGKLNQGAKAGRITLKNGVFDVKERVLLPHERSYYNCYALDVNYNGKATCENWLSFLDSIFEGDVDKQEKIDCLQEFMGYCLTTSVKFQRALFLSGSGCNGKGVFLDILQSILEPASVNMSLSDLSDPNRAVGMIGKTLAFDGDIEKSARFNDGTFKKAVVGEDINIKILYKNAATYRPFVKFVLAGNSLPRTKDTSNGYFRRWIIIKFNQSFLGREDFSLKAKLMAEKDGIFNWMLKGLERLEENNQITIPQSSNENIGEYMRLASSIHSFFHDKITVYNAETHGQNIPEVKASKLYGAYKVYCVEAGLNPIARNTFYKDFEEMFDAPTETDRNKCKVFLGIELQEQAF